MELCYDIATEGFNIANIKEKVKTAFGKIKRIFQKIIDVIKNVINKLLSKINRSKKYKINRDYYNNIMHIIHKVESFDVSYTKKIKAYVGAATFDCNKVDSIYADIISKMQELKDLEVNASKVKPSMSGPIAEISENHFNEMKEKFQNMYYMYMNDIQNINAIYNTAMSLLSKSNSLNDKVKDEYTISQLIESILTVSTRNARLNLMKANLLISLTNMISTHFINEGDEYNTDYENAHYKNVKNNTPNSKSSNNSDKGGYSLMTVESVNMLIDFCDNYQITNESLISAKRTVKKEMKYIKNNDVDISTMPDRTKEQINDKLKAIRNQRDDIKDLISRIKSEKADVVDRMISVAAHVVNAGLKITSLFFSTDLSAKIVRYNDSIYNVWKDLGIILGTNLAASLVKQATIKNKKEFIDSTIYELRKRDRLLIKMETTLNNKLNSL